MTVDVFYTCDFIYSHGMPRHANHLMCVLILCMYHDNSGLLLTRRLS